MQNVKQIWQETAKRLEKVYDSREAENISYLLLEDVFKISRADILTETDKSVLEDKLENLIRRLLKKEPIQHVTGVADFYGRKFQISPGALIPRPETEELCDLIIKENKQTNLRILDVGVGSGCISVTLNLELKSKVYGVDISDEAIDIANQNATSLKSSATFLKSDVLSEELPEKDLDILVSNPPYIPMREKVEMSGNVLEYEPALALFVPNDDPILFYKRISELGLKSLKKEGKLYFEIHENYGKQVTDFLKAVGYLDVILYQDMQGKDRMVSAVRV
ncbi:peptide chain release factor N(5)-glutamine methyltransferase [Ekhidna sp.]|uniref:peptide chain release factor N(5)-glutamine methyltransferase n=1 Tax=Ekhidna sp. TaxID=2608089 RepID=UPI003298D44C